MPGRNRVPSFQLASGTTNERDNSYNISNTPGSIFYNTDTSNVEFSDNVDISGNLGVSGNVVLAGGYYFNGGSGSVVRKQYITDNTQKTHSDDSGANTAANTWFDQYSCTYTKIFPDSLVIIEACLIYRINYWGDDEYKGRIKTGTDKTSTERKHWSYKNYGGGSRSEGINPLWYKDDQSTANITIIIQTFRTYDSYSTQPGDGGAKTNDDMDMDGCEFIITEIRP